MTIDFSNKAGVRVALRKSLKFLNPPKKLLPSEFAEAHCRIPAGNAMPGPVRLRNSPHTIEPLNLIAAKDCYRITLMWGAQLAKTTTQQFAMAYYIGHDPKNMMMMQPSQSDLKTWLNSKFNPMVESSELLSSRVAAPRGRDGVNNQEMKTYPGGQLMFAYSGSPKTMRGRSAGIIFCDETDGYERTAEGNPVSLLEQRSATFGDGRLLFETSTPTLKDISHIENAFEQGDKRRYFVTCMDCGEKQYLKWGQVTWQKDEAGEHLPHTAAYCCEHCGSLWDDSQRFKAIDRGEWIAEKPFKGHASFHAPEMLSKFRKLGDIVQSFLDKKALGDLQTFTNVSLAETWAVESLKRDPDLLYARREHYKEQVPKKAVWLSCSIDVQDDRLEAQVEGWGDDQENWKIHYTVLRGNLNDSEIWERLDSFLDKSYKHESGVTLNVSASTIDTGGHFTQQTYDYVKRSRHQIFAIKGSSARDANLVGTPSKNNLGGVNLYTLGVHKLKQQIVQRSGIEKPGAGYVHFPVADDFELDWFMMYTAEELVTKYVKGERRDEWRKIRPRNESFDLSVYNLACLIIYAPDFDFCRRQIESKIYKDEPKKPKPQQQQAWINNSNQSWL